MASINAFVAVPSFLSHDSWRRCQRRSTEAAAATLPCKSLGIPPVSIARRSSSLLLKSPKSHTIVASTTSSRRDSDVSADDEALQTNTKVASHEDATVNAVNVSAIDGTVLLERPYTNGKIKYTETHKKDSQQPQVNTIRNLWKRRHARSIEEGLRRERQNSATGKQLSTLLQVASTSLSDSKNKRTYAARTIAGLIVALAEEAHGLEVQVDARDDTPLREKHVNEIRIDFKRLGFKPLRMGGLDQVLKDVGSDLPRAEKDIIASSLRRRASSTSIPTSADEAFDRIDTDRRGALDEEDLTIALSLAAPAHGRSDAGGSSSKESKKKLARLASRLVSLYDTNGDGVVDREEYGSMVEDMSALRRALRARNKGRKLGASEKKKDGGSNNKSSWWEWWYALRRTVLNVFKRNVINFVEDGDLSEIHKLPDDIDVHRKVDKMSGRKKQVNFEGAQVVQEDSSLLASMTKAGGSIVLSDIKLDLRRLLFGGVPWLKKITPGGPLILEPFTMTITASFAREDVLDSNLLMEGLRRLVVRALRRRVRSVRDLIDGAVFYGRTWNTASKHAPIVEVPKLTNVEFDRKNRIIVTGRARVRAAPDQPFIENSFKLRTKFGTRENGQFIRLKDPELALIAECPKAWERNIVSACKKLNLPTPRRPEPLYAFFPLVSPLKTTEQDGFNLGEDNRIKSIDVNDGVLRFEASAVLRPGRFLGNHYLAFTVPNRTFIATTDRVREAIRIARRNKKAAAEAAKMAVIAENQGRASSLSADLREENGGAATRSLFSREDTTSSVFKGLDRPSATTTAYDKDLSFLDTENIVVEEVVPPVGVVGASSRPGFFSRFVEGYLDAAREETEEERNERLTTAISEFFGSSDDDFDDNREFTAAIHNKE